MQLFKNLSRASKMGAFYRPPVSMAQRQVQFFATRAGPQGSETGLTDVAEVFKTNYTVEFDQGLTDEQKANMKRFDIYRSNPNDPDDRP